jgi:hypothetical protein
MTYRFKWLILLVFIAGLIILLLPDKSKPLIELNRSHGPSFIDIVGLALMFISWIICLLDIIKNWRQLKIKMGNQILFGLIFIYLVSNAGIIIGLNLSIEIILWVSVAVASIINMVLIIFTYNITVHQIQDSKAIS